MIQMLIILLLELLEYDKEIMITRILQMHCRNRKILTQVMNKCHNRKDAMHRSRKRASSFFFFLNKTFHAAV